MRDFTPSFTMAALALSLTTPLSPKNLYQALRQQGSAKQLLARHGLLPQLFAPGQLAPLQDFLARGPDSALGQQVAAQQQRLSQCQARVLALGDSDYPVLLGATDDAPPLLYLRGNADALHLPSLALVGARSCTAQGGDNAERFARQLAQNGFSIVSGLAVGIDGRAHRGALAARGITVAVMATGIDHIYPARHRQLAQEIVANNGALITELPPGSKPLRRHFPQRNRIISGLSLGVLVVEAKVKSGSLITARTASEQNREVFAIPGSIHNPMARGCHQLIKSGAKLVESTADIAEELAALLAFKQTELQRETKDGEGQVNHHKPTGEEHPILSALGYEAKTLDELSALLNVSIDELMIEVLNLEIAGQVVQANGRIERLTF